MLCSKQQAQSEFYSSRTWKSDKAALNANLSKMVTSTAKLQTSEGSTNHTEEKITCSSPRRRIWNTLLFKKLLLNSYSRITLYWKQLFQTINLMNLKSLRKQLANWCSNQDKSYSAFPMKMSDIRIPALLKE